MPKRVRDTRSRCAVLQNRLLNCGGIGRLTVEDSIQLELLIDVYLLLLDVGGTVNLGGSHVVWI